MRIATMVAGSVTTPQPFGVTYAPMDIAIAMSEGLQALGHQVDYYGPEGTNVNLPVITCDLKPFSSIEYEISPFQEPNLSRIWDEALICEMVRRANNGDYDALVIHPIDRGILFGRLTNAPIVYVLHDPIEPWRADIYRQFLTPNQYLVSITDAQRNPEPALPYIATVYNGVDVDMFSFNETPSNHVIFAGRMISKKNPSGAILAAQMADTPIKLFGQVPSDDSSYFDEQVKTRLNEKSTYEGFVGRSELAAQYGQAKALLAPITWEEPFGLVFTEAMACGTPVIAFRRGSVPEVIVDGVTGFIVDTIEEMAEAIKKIDTIDRRACRDHVISKFSNQCMIEAYDKVLTQIVKNR